MHDFIGLAVCVINNFFERKILILDITKMPGNSHNAENIKEAIEAMINKFEFDKSKIIATVSDEGSAYLRLFK